MKRDSSLVLTAVLVAALAAEIVTSSPARGAIMFTSSSASLSAYVTGPGASDSHSLNVPDLTSVNQSVSAQAGGFNAYAGVNALLTVSRIALEVVVQGVGSVNQNFTAGGAADATVNFQITDPQMYDLQLSTFLPAEFHLSGPGLDPLHSYPPDSHLLLAAGDYVMTEHVALNNHGPGTGVFVSATLQPVPEAGAAALFALTIAAQALLAQRGRSIRSA